MRRLGVGPWLADALRERLALMAPSRRLRLAQAVELAERSSDARSLRVLDAGCGDGLLTLSMARRHPHWRIVGVDLNAELLLGATARANARNLTNVTFVKGDLTRPIAGGAFDVIFALECLSEISDDRAALSSMVEALSPSGLLIVQVPERHWSPVLPGSDPIWRHEVRHGYDDEEFVAILVDAGMERVAIRPTFRNTAALAQELRDRMKASSLAIRVLAFPFMVTAVWFERAGITWGPARALLASATRGNPTPPVA